MESFFKKLENYGVDMKEIENRFLGNKEFYMECFQMFKEGKEVKNLKNALDSKNYDQAFNEAHTIKGIVGNLGLKPLFNKISPLVEALRNTEIKDIENLSDSVFEEIETVLNII